MANLADLMIQLGADPSGIEEGMSRGKKLAMVGGAAIAAAVGAAAFAAMDISAANDKLAAQLGLSEVESARVGGVAGSLFANAYGQNMGQVNDAVGAVMSSIKGMRTASDADLQAVTATALDFATAFDVDVTRAVDVAGRAVNSGLAKNATEAFDLLVAASQKVPAALREDVLDATDEYGQFFAGIGIKGPQAFAIMVDAADKGSFGIDKVGDAIKEFTILSTDGSASTTEAFEAMGLNAKTMTNSILAGGDSAANATQKIVDGLLGIKDPGEQAATAISLFGAPLEDLNVKDIPEFLKTMSAGSDSMQGFAGAAGRMGATLNDNASTNITAFRRQAQMAFVDLVGGAVIPLIEKGSKFLAYTLGPAITTVAGFLGSSLVPALKATAGFMQDNQRPITIIATVIGALLLPALVVAAAQMVTTGAAAVASWAVQSAAAVRGAATTFAALTRVAAAWVMSAARSMASAAIMAASWLLAMGPIPWIIAAVVGLAILIVKNWDTIKGATIAAWNAISGAVSAAVGAVKNVVTTVFAAIKSVVTTYVNAWVAIVKGAVGFIMGAIRGIGAIVGVVTGFFAGVVSGVRTKIGEVVSLVKGLPGRAISALGNLGSSLRGLGLDFIQGFINGIISKAAAIPGVIRDKVVGVAKSALKGFGLFGSPSRLTEEFGGWWTEGFVDGIENGGAALSGAGADMVGRLGDQVAQAADLAAGLGAAFTAPGMDGDLTYGTAAGLGAARTAPGSSGGGPQTIRVQLEWVGDSDLFEVLRKGVRVRGGNVQTVLGRG